MVDTRAVSSSTVMIIGTMSAVVGVAASLMNPLLSRDREITVQVTQLNDRTEALGRRLDHIERAIESLQVSGRGIERDRKRYLGDVPSPN